MTGEFHLRLARPGEEDAIVQFLDAHWEWKLPLVHVPQFFEFYYRPFGGAPQFALALPGACRTITAWPRKAGTVWRAWPRRAFCPCPKPALRCAACPARRPCRACSACSRSCARSKITGTFHAAISPTPSKAMTCGQAKRASICCARARCP